MLLGIARCAYGSPQPLSDAELADVRAAGLAFNLQGFSLSGGLSLTYTGANGNTLTLSNLSLSRSDDPAATFSDPYRLQIVPRSGLPDVIQLSEPANANGLLKWQLAADWAVNANGADFQGGALVVQDLQSYGGTLTLAPPAATGVEGFAFGLSLRADVGNLLLRPRGRDDTANADAPGVAEQFRIQGLHLGAANGGALPTAPWAIADATTQPGILNAVTENGRSTLHIGIDWPTNGVAPQGTLLIDNVSFKTDAAGFIDPSSGNPGSGFSLGSSRIATVQLQYLDIKLRP